MRFEIGNTWTWVLDSPDPFLHHIDRALRYPTDIARAKEAGFVSPDDTEWDGWVRFLRKPKLSPPRFPTGLLGRVLELARAWNLDFEEKDLRKPPEDDVLQRFEPIPLREYQKQAVEEAVRIGRGVVDCPPRSGKTRLMCEIHRRIAQRTVWIAPTDNIVKQTVATVEEFFGEYHVMQLTGTRELDRAVTMHVVVCTAATAAMLPERFWKTREMLVVDEWHHGGAKTYRDIFKQCDHIYYRFGMTGTFFRTGDDEMEMHALLSHTIYKVDAKYLLEEGYLVPTRVAFVPVEGKLRGVTGTTFQSGHGKFGIHEHERRNQLASMSAVLLEQTGRKVLVLVGTKKQGYLLKQQIGAFMRGKEHGAEFEPVEFVSTDVNRPMQSRILKAFLESDEVRVLIGTSLLGEGTDLPSCDALVYAKGEKADVTLTQNAYRVCTAVEGKKDAIIVDFADRHNRKLLKHSSERLKIYYGIPIFKVTPLQSMTQFVDWLKTGGI